MWALLLFFGVLPACSNLSGLVQGFPTYLQVWTVSSAIKLINVLYFADLYCIMSMAMLHY